MASLRKASDLRPYQKFLADVIVEKPAALLAVPMGLGKTVSTLTAMRRLLDEFMVRKWLVIAPLRVARETWPDEIGEWEHTAVLSFTLIEGSPEKRSKLLQEQTEIHIINRELVPWLVEVLGREWPYDGVVWDESSALKSWKKRTPPSKKKVKLDENNKPIPPKKTNKRVLTRFGAIAHVRSKIRWFVELTGTPTSGGLMDLGGQIYILDQGQRLGASRTAFENRWFDSDYMGWSFTPKPHAEKEIMAAVSDIMIGLRSEDYIKLPPVWLNPRWITLPSGLLDEYDEFERNLVSEAYDVEAVSRGVLANKLLQFANGAMYRNPASENEKRQLVSVHDLKLDELERVVEEAAGASILVAYSYQFDLDRIKKKYPKAVVFDNTPGILKDWNAGKIPLLVAHPASVGHGLNMQYGGHIACWYGLTWSLELYQQFNARLPRPGQKSSLVTIHHIVARNTVDADVLEALGRKGATQDRVLDAVRVRVLKHEKKGAL